MKKALIIVVSLMIALVIVIGLLLNNQLSFVNSEQVLLISIIVLATGLLFIIKNPALYGISIIIISLLSGFFIKGPLPIIAMFFVSSILKYLSWFVIIKVIYYIIVKKRQENSISQVSQGKNINIAQDRSAKHSKFAVLNIALISIFTSYFVSNIILDRSNIFWKGLEKSAVSGILTAVIQFITLVLIIVVVELVIWRYLSNESDQRLVKPGINWVKIIVFLITLTLLTANMRHYFISTVNSKNNLVRSRTATINDAKPKDISDQTFTVAKSYQDILHPVINENYSAWIQRGSDSKYQFAFINLNDGNTLVINFPDKYNNNSLTDFSELHIVNSSAILLNTKDTILFDLKNLVATHSNAAVLRDPNDKLSLSKNIDSSPSNLTLLKINSNYAITRWKNLNEIYLTNLISGEQTKISKNYAIGDVILNTDSIMVFELANHSRNSVHKVSIENLDKETIEEGVKNNSEYGGNDINHYEYDLVSTNKDRLVKSSSIDNKSILIWDGEQNRKITIATDQVPNLLSLSANYLYFALKNDVYRINIFNNKKEKVSGLQKLFVNDLGNFQRALSQGKIRFSDDRVIAIDMRVIGTDKYETLNVSKITTE